MDQLPRRRIWERTFPQEETRIVLEYDAEWDCYLFTNDSMDSVYFEPRYLPELIKGLQEELTRRQHSKPTPHDLKWRSDQK